MRRHFDEEAAAPAIDAGKLPISPDAASGTAAMVTSIQARNGMSGMLPVPHCRRVIYSLFLGVGVTRGSPASARQPFVRFIARCRLPDAPPMPLERHSD